MSKKQAPRFKEGDVVRVTFVTEVVDVWHDPLGKPVYALHVDSTFGEECLEPWVEEENDDA